MYIEKKYNLRGRSITNYPKIENNYGTINLSKNNVYIKKHLKVCGMNIVVSIRRINIVNQR